MKKCDNLAARLSVLTKCWRQQSFFCCFTPILAGHTTSIPLHQLNGLHDQPMAFLESVLLCPKIMSMLELHMMTHTAMSTNAKHPDHHVLKFLVSQYKYLSSMSGLSILFDLYICFPRFSGLSIFSPFSV